MAHLHTVAKQRFASDTSEYSAWQTDWHPGWQSGADNRLCLGMLLAAIVIGMTLSFLRYPPVSELAPVFELIVELAPEPSPEPPQQTTNVPQPAAVALPPPLEEATDTPQVPVVDPVPEVVATTDWASLARDAVERAVDAEMATVGVNPAFDEKRRRAATTFRPSAAPVKKPVWENVEKDQMGRTILRLNDCYRVLDDPRVANEWAFRNFEQYTVFCSGSNQTYLIEFDEVTERYFYLEEEERK